MLEKYESLNLKAKEYLSSELNNICREKKRLDRCYKEIDLLFDNSVLFIIEILYKYKKKNGTSYHFRGMINNLLLLYILGISDVDPVKYDLPHELISSFNINVDLIGDCSLSLIWFIEEEYKYELKVIYGTHEKEEIQEIDLLVDNHYLLIPNETSEELLSKINFKLNDFFLFETVEDYRNYKNDFLTIRIDEKSLVINSNGIHLKNIFTNDVEVEIAKILKPKTIDDYIKIKSIGHGANVWDHNQDTLVKEGKINLDNLIATREDILEYLLEHSIERNTALEIFNFIRKARPKKEPKKWNKYVKIMKKHKCEDMFIDIFSKILFIFGRGQAVSECLFVLDKENYIDLEDE